MAERRSKTFWFFLVVLVAILAALVFYRGQRPKKEAYPAWIRDFEAAKQLAREENKDLFINFSGSDWCYWCQRLEREVLTDAEFVIPTQKDFVFVLVDFPRDTSRQTPQEQEQNQKLAEQFAVGGYPTIILADADGSPYARTGYQEGGGKAYLGHIQELQSQKNQSDISK